MSTQYAVRNIISDFKRNTGKDIYEWRKILLEKHHIDKAAARKYMSEKGLTDGYIDFLLWTSSEHLRYSSSKEESIP